MWEILLQAQEALEKDSNFFWLLSLLIVLFIILDAFSALAKSKRKLAGIDLKIDNVLFPSAIFKETKYYSSEIQGLASRPDALLVENGYMIPVDRKLSSNKVRERYIIEVLVHMRLVEEFEGKKPPHAYLILGKNARRVKVSNTEKRQKWLDSIIQEMQSIEQGSMPAKADPHPKKCPRCNMLKQCKTGQKAIST